MKFLFAILVLLSACTTSSGPTTESSKVASCDFGSPEYRALESAAFGGNALKLGQLLAKGLDVNCRYREHHWSDYTILMAAAINGHDAAVKMILSYNPDLNLESDHDSACTPGTAYILSKFLAKKESAAKLILEAAQKRKIKIVQKAVDCG
jgi:ankyrin repeat protein